MASPAFTAIDCTAIRSDSIAVKQPDSSLLQADAIDLLRRVLVRSAILEQLFYSYRVDAEIETRKVLPLSKSRIGKTDPSSLELSFHYYRPDRVDSVRIHRFASLEPERNRKLDRAALDMLTGNCFAPQLHFSGPQSIPNPLRLEAGDHYKYRLDSLSSCSGKSLYYYSFRSLTGLATGTLHIDADALSISHFSIDIYLKGIYREGFELDYGEVIPSVQLPIRLRSYVRRSRIFYSQQQSYNSELLYKDLQIDSTVFALNRSYSEIDSSHSKTFQSYLPRILDKYQAYDGDKWRLSDKTPELRIYSSREALGREDSTSFWSRIYLNSKGQLQEYVPWWKAALWGHDYKVGERWSFGNEGLVWSAFYYNYADSFWLGQSFNIRYDYAPGRRFELSPALYYVIRRDVPAWMLSARLHYSPKRRGLFELDAGHRSYDLSDAREKSDQVTDMLMSLLDGQGPTTRYDDKYLRLSNRIDLSEQFELYSSVMLADRNPLPHGTAWSFLGFSMAEILSFSNASADVDRYVPPHRLLELKARLSYNPRPFYRYDSKGYKERVREGIAAPLIVLSYRGALGMGRPSDARFHHLDLSVQQSISLGSMRSFFYQINLGGYLDRTQIYPSEYFFLKGSNAFWRFDYSLETSFQTLPPYTATERNHFILQSSYRAPRIFVNFFPLLWLRTNDEALHAKFRWDLNFTKPYIELGYSQGIGSLLRIGLFYGAYNLLYDKGAAIRFTFNM